MKSDEQAIRGLVDRWLAASKSGDLATVLSLMADDVVFMVPGREPFGKQEFATGSKGQAPKLVDSQHRILELQVAGNWAWMRSHLEITLSQPDGAKVQRAGYILTVLRRQSDDSWVIARDANLLAPKSGG